jgi:hypothetical protein
VNGHINRIAPSAPAAAYKSYELKRPATPEFWRAATCAEVDCAAWRNGWVTSIDTDLPLGQAQARYIRLQSGRSYTVVESAGGLVEFTFAAGQRCFEAHRVAREREALLIVRGGDWRGNPTGERYVHRSFEDFADEMHEHTDKLATAREREGVAEMISDTKEQS